MPDRLDFLDALFDPDVHEFALFDGTDVVGLHEFEDAADTFTEVSAATPAGQAFVVGVLDDVEDDAYLGCRLVPHAALYRDGTMLLLWVTAKAYTAKEISPLVEALEMEAPDDVIPLPGVDGWRCVHADPRAGYTLAKMMKAYGEAPVPAAPRAAKADAPPWEDETYLDAKVVGPFDPNDPLLDQAIITTYGPKRESLKWTPVKGTIGKVIQTLCEHKVGEKDGLGMVLGDQVPGRRLKTAVKALYAVGLDVDVGTPTAVIDKALEKLGKLAVRYSTHSHLKASTEFKRDRVVKWSEKNAEGAEIDDELIRDFLAAEEGWDDAIIDSAAYAGDEHGPSGIMAAVEHLPMPKNRIFVPLKVPFVISEQGATQQDAMKAWGKVPTALAQMLGVPLDTSCLDPSRLFYLPRHGKGRPHETTLFGGSLFDWRDLELSNPWEDIAETMSKGPGSGGKSTTERGKSLGRWSMKRAHGFLIRTAIEDHADEKIRNKTGTGIEIECPFDEDHSNPGDPEDRACLAVDAGDGPSDLFTISCRHESCQGRTNLDMLGRMLDDGWFGAEVLEDDQYFGAEAETAPNPEAAKRIEREDKAAATWASALDALPENADDEAVTNVIRLALEANPTTVERERLPLLLKAKLDLPLTAIRKVIKAVQAEVVAEENENNKIIDPFGRSTFSYSGEYNFDEAYLAGFRALIHENRTTKLPVFTCFQDTPVRMTKTPEGRVTFDPLTSRAVWAELNTRLTFMRLNDQGAPGARGQVPIEVANHVFELAYDILPQTPDIVYTPLFIPDKKEGAILLETPGWYDDAKNKSNLMLADIGFNVPPVKIMADAQDLDDAVNYLQRDVLGEFPFSDFDTQGIERPEPSLANAMAMLITPFMRRLINSPTPVFFISKPQSGTGGTLLGSIPIIMFDGIEPTPEPYTQNEEEMRKSLLASIMTTRSHLFFDDVREFNNRVLLQSITSHNIGGRLLGATKTVERPNTFNWIATGNNPAIGAEMERRIVRIRLNYKAEEVGKRVFKNKFPYQFLKQNRAKMVHAVLTIIQYWIDMGMPLFEERKRASFEDWSAKVGGVLMTAGIEGFLDNAPPPTADMEEAAIKFFVKAWYRRFGIDYPLPMSDLFKFAFEGEYDIADGNNDDQKKSRFMRRLPHLEGRTFSIDDKSIMMRAGLDGDKNTVYRLVETAPVVSLDAP